MVTSTIALVTCLFLGTVLAQVEPQPGLLPQKSSNATEAIIAVGNILLDDEFEQIETIEIESEEKGERKKRNAGLLGRLGGDYGCGAAPTAGISFARCFTPGNSYFQRSNMYKNYYRQGNYGNCLNYFRSLPLSNVAQTGTGYTGQLNGLGGRIYSVDACQRCYGGLPGISMRGLSRPYNHLVRRFIFTITVTVDVVYPGDFPGDYPGDFPGGYPVPYPGGYPGSYPGVNPGMYPRVNPGGYAGGRYAGGYAGGFPGSYAGGYPGGYAGGYPGVAGGYTPNSGVGSSGYGGYGGYGDGRQGCIGTGCAGYGLNGARCNGAGCTGYADPACVGTGCGGVVNQGCATGTVC